MGVQEGGWISTNLHKSLGAPQGALLFFQSYILYLSWSELKPRPYTKYIVTAVLVHIAVA